MTRVSEVIHEWLGWCPDARIGTISQQGTTGPGNPVQLPGGGSPGSGRISRGKDIAVKSMQILVQNRQLLWFPFLMVLTFIVSIPADLSVRSISGASALPGVMNSPAILWAVLTFAAAFLEHFVFFSLAAGLIICVSQIPSGNSVSLRKGLSRAWDHNRSIAVWTCIGALLWVSAGPFAIGFYLITVFALPAMVLGNKDPAASLRESIVTFRGMWVETYVSFGSILLVALGFALITLFSLGQVASAYGSISGGIITGMIGLVMPVVMAMGLVVMGIATVILYTGETTKSSF